MALGNVSSAAEAAKFILEMMGRRKGWPKILGRSLERLGYEKQEIERVVKAAQEGKLDDLASAVKTTETPPSAGAAATAEGIASEAQAIADAARQAGAGEPKRSFLRKYGLPAGVTLAGAGLAYRALSGRDEEKQPAPTQPQPAEARAPESPTVTVTFSQFAEEIYPAVVRDYPQIGLDIDTQIRLGQIRTKKQAIQYMLERYPSVFGNVRVIGVSELLPKREAKPEPQPPEPRQLTKAPEKPAPSEPPPAPKVETREARAPEKAQEKAAAPEGPPALKVERVAPSAPKKEQERPAEQRAPVVKALEAPRQEEWRIERRPQEGPQPPTARELATSQLAYSIDFMRGFVHGIGYEAKELATDPFLLGLVLATLAVNKAGAVAPVFAKLSQAPVVGTLLTQAGKAAARVLGSNAWSKLNDLFAGVWAVQSGASLAKAADLLDQGKHYEAGKEMAASVVDALFAVPTAKRILIAANEKIRNAPSLRSLAERLIGGRGPAPAAEPARVSSRPPSPAPGTAAVSAWSTAPTSTSGEPPKISVQIVGQTPVHGAIGASGTVPGTGVSGAPEPVTTPPPPAPLRAVPAPGVARGPQPKPIGVEEPRPLVHIGGSGISLAARRAIPEPTGPAVRELPRAARGAAAEPVAATAPRVPTVAAQIPRREAALPRAGMPRAEMLPVEVSARVPTEGAPKAPQEPVLSATGVRTPQREAELPRAEIRPAAGTVPVGPPPARGAQAIAPPMEAPRTPAHAATVRLPRPLSEMKPQIVSSSADVMRKLEASLLERERVEALIDSARAKGEKAGKDLVQGAAPVLGGVGPSGTIVIPENATREDILAILNNLFRPAIARQPLYDAVIRDESISREMLARTGQLLFPAGVPDQVLSAIVRTGKAKFEPRIDYRETIGEDLEKAVQNWPNEIKPIGEKIADALKKSPIADVTFAGVHNLPDTIPQPGKESAAIPSGLLLRSWLNLMGVDLLPGAGKIWAVPLQGMKTLAKVLAGPEAASDELLAGQYGQALARVIDMVEESGGIPGINTIVRFPFRTGEASGRLLGYDPRTLHAVVEVEGGSIHVPMFDIRPVGPGPAPPVARVTQPQVGQKVPAGADPDSRAYDAFLVSMADSLAEQMRQKKAPVAIYVNKLKEQESEFIRDWNRMKSMAQPEFTETPPSTRKPTEPKGQKSMAVTAEKERWKAYENIPTKPPKYARRPGEPGPVENIPRPPEVSSPLALTDDVADLYWASGQPEQLPLKFGLPVPFIKEAFYPTRKRIVKEIERGMLRADQLYGSPYATRIRKLVQKMESARSAVERDRALAEVMQLIDENQYAREIVAQALLDIIRSGERSLFDNYVRFLRSEALSQVKELGFAPHETVTADKLYLGGKAPQVLKLFGIKPDSPVHLTVPTDDAVNSLTMRGQIMAPLLRSAAEQVRQWAESIAQGMPDPNYHALFDRAFRIARDVLEAAMYEGLPEGKLFWQIRSLPSVPTAYLASLQDISQDVTRKTISNAMMAAHRVLTGLVERAGTLEAEPYKPLFMHLAKTHLGSVVKVTIPGESATRDPVAFKAVLANYMSGPSRVEKAARSGSKVSPLPDRDRPDIGQTYLLDSYLLKDPNRAVLAGEIGFKDQPSKWWHKIRIDRETGFLLPGTVEELYLPVYGEVKAKIASAIARRNMITKPDQLVPGTTIFAPSATGGEYQLLMANEKVGEIAVEERGLAADIYRMWVASVHPENPEHVRMFPRYYMVQTAGESRERRHLLNKAQELGEKDPEHPAAGAHFLTDFDLRWLSDGDLLKWINKVMDDMENLTAREATELGARLKQIGVLPDSTRYEHAHAISSALLSGMLSQMAQINIPPARLEMAMRSRESAAALAAEIGEILRRYPEDKANRISQLLARALEGVYYTSAAPQIPTQAITLDVRPARLASVPVTEAPPVQKEPPLLPPAEP